MSFRRNPIRERSLVSSQRRTPRVCFTSIKKKVESYQNIYYVLRADERYGSGLAESLPEAEAGDVTARSTK